MSLAFMGPPLTGELFVETPFTEAARAANPSGLWSSWGRNALPDVFDGIPTEVSAIRETAMMEDKSPLAKIHIRGPDAERFVDRLVPRDATKIASNHANYTPWCNDDGKVIVEGMLLRLGETDFIVTAGLMDRWLTAHLGSLDVEFADVTDRFGILALQGPNSLAILEEATGRDWADLRFSRARPAEIASAPVHVWRTGFTGVKGYEFWVPPEAGTAVWEALLATPTGATIEPCGHASQDVVRVEAGMVLPAIDYARAGPDAVMAHSYGLTDEEHQASPFEINLGRFVDFGKPDFAGRLALREESQATDRGRRMWGMRADWRQLVTSCVASGQVPIVDGKMRRFPPLKLLCDGDAVGFATSVGWSPFLRDLIGFAHLPATQRPEGGIALLWEQDGETFEVPATVEPLPFVKPTRT